MLPIDYQISIQHSFPFSESYVVPFVFDTKGTKKSSRPKATPYGTSGMARVRFLPPIVPDEWLEFRQETQLRRFLHFAVGRRAVGRR